MERNILRKSFVNAGGVFVYVSAIAGFLNGAKLIFNNMPNFVAPIFMLLLFIISACVTAFLVLEKPIRMYLDGERTYASKLLFATLTWLAIFLFAIATILFFS